MRAGCAFLGLADVQGGRSEVHLIPTQVNQFGRPEAVPKGHQQHGGVPVAVAVALGGVDEPLDFGFRQMLAAA